MIHKVTRFMEFIGRGRHEVWRIGGNCLVVWPVPHGFMRWFAEPGGELHGEIEHRFIPDQNGDAGSCTMAEEIPIEFLPMVAIERKRQLKERIAIMRGFR